MKMVSHLNIREFRGIKTCKSPIEFSDFTVLIGRNNSGKSSILEALSLLPFPTENYHLEHVGGSRIELIKSLHNDDKKQKRSCLTYGYSGQALITYQLQSQKMSVEIEDDRARDLRLNDKVLDREKMFRNDEFRRMFPVPNDYDLNRLTMFIPNDSQVIQKMVQKLIQPEIREEITKKGLNVKITKDLINQVVDDIYTEILTEHEVLRFRKELPDGNLLYIYLDDLGDGIRRATILSMLIELYDPKLILWDDFEGPAHPTLVRKLVEWLAHKDCQVVISTHSNDVLRSVLDVQPDNAIINLCKKDDADTLYTKSYDIDDFEDIFYSNTDPRLLGDSLGL